ncbi:TPA: hypothetical protein PXO92_004614 [Yersinia enterocolitica]|nr:hypothetical protein [Yersinia enterocolitica]
MKRPASLSLKIPTAKLCRLDKSHLIFNEWLGNDFINIICSSENNGTRFKQALIKLEKYSIGKELIKTLHVITIFKKIRILIDLNSSNTGVIPDDIESASNFKGCGSVLMINFNHDGINKNDGISMQDKDCIILFHELLHVYHNAIGERVRIITKTDIYSPNLHEEAKTVGLGSFRNNYITENKLREEMSLPRRYNYDSVNDSDTILSLNGTFPLFPIQ